MLTIGRLGGLTGVQAKTLRYYDRVGLVRPTARTRAGYRLYDEGAIDRLEFIRRAKALGMSLADIRRMLAVREDGAAPCEHVLELVARKIDELESQIVELQTLRADLLRLRRELKRRIPPQARAAEDCPCFEIIRAFQKPQANGQGRRGTRPPRQ